MSEYRNHFSTFNSVANPAHILDAVIAVDGDVHLVTKRMDGSGNFQNAQIRLRTLSGGGRSILLRNIMAGIIEINREASGQANFLDTLYAANIPNHYEEFEFHCDDNPGSNLKIAISDDLFGIQTNCHDEEKDRASGGFMSWEGEGAMVWLHKDMLPKVYAELKAYLIDKKVPDETLYGDRAFHFMKLEAA